MGICGQAPSDYPEVAEFLVRQGIDSISLTPDRIIETTRLVARIEEERRRPAAPDSKTSDRLSGT